MKVLLGSLVFLALAAPSLMAQRAWKGGDGDWHDAAKWTTGVPIANTTAQFPYHEDGEPIVVSINNNAVTQSMQIGEGVDLTLRLGSNVSLTTSSSWRIGYSLAGTGSGPAKLTVEGPATGTGWLNLTAGASNNQFFLNNASTLVLRGANLRVESAESTGLGTLAANHNNTIELHDGVIFKTASFRLGWTSTGYSGGNSLKVRSGSTLQVVGNSGLIGSNIGHFNNYLSVTGTNSKVEFVGQTLLVGDEAEANHGGNYAELADGGSVTTNSAIKIYGHNTAESAHGANRITIGAGGRITSSDSIEVGQATSTSATLLQLHEGGELDGSATVRVNSRGVFEAAGDGLGADVDVNITQDGTLAIGSIDATQPATLSLKGTAHFDEGGFLRMGIYAEGVDELNLATGAELIGKITLLLDYEHVELGASYTLFTGDTAGITAEFDLNHLDPQLWDFSQFSAAGGWQLRAIPEPSSLALLAAGAAFAGWVGRRKARRQMLPLLAGATVALGLGGGALEAAEEITVLDGEMEVERASEIRLSVALPEVTPDDEAVLEFTAWYPAPKHAGYYSAMRVYWAAQELEDILDRPTTFQTLQGKKEGRTSPIRRRKSWMVPVVPSPEDFSPMERSYVSPEQMNPFLFRFRLPATQGGEYELRITNSMKDDHDPKQGYQIFPILKVRDVVVRLEPKP